MVRLKVLVNGEYLNTFCGDGLILSTPTGSTGYNMSAGGPIVAPKAQMILITPINPHNLHSRSIVIGAEDEVTVELVPRRHQQDETVEVSFDGDHAKKLEVGDRVVIRKASETARICRISNESFLEILGKKMRTYTLDYRRRGKRAVAATRIAERQETRMKTRRQAKILELISRNDIETQEELSDYLEREGYQVTQATVSRDIRELKLTKLAMSGGRQKYVALVETSEDLSEKYKRIFRDGFLSMDMAQNILVHKNSIRHGDGGRRRA